MSSLEEWRQAVAPFLKHEPIRMLEGYYPTPPYPELRTWQEKVYGHYAHLFEDGKNPFAGGFVSPDLGDDADDRMPCVPPSCPSFTDTTLHPEPVMYPTFENGIASGHAPMDPEGFERAILHTQAEYEKAMGVKPTVIDLPNWCRGTILEQIAFTNGFTIADRRPDED